MVENYIRQQHEWLGRLYPAPDSRFETTPSQPTIEPQSPQAHIIQTFQDLLESKYSTQEAAERLASTILSTADIMTSYNNIWGCFFQAVEHFSSLDISSTSSDLLAYLASLADAVDTHQEIIVLGSPDKVTIQPGRWWSETRGSLADAVTMSSAISGSEARRKRFNENGR